MSNMHRAGGVDTDELDHDLAAGANVGCAEGIAGDADGFDLLLQPRFAELEVDEARRRGGYAVDLRRALDALRDELGQLERVGAGGPGEAQRQVGGEVAVFRRCWVARPQCRARNRR